jgi:hypothetical protein
LKYAFDLEAEELPDYFFLLIKPQGIAEKIIKEKQWDFDRQYVYFNFQIKICHQSVVLLKYII